MMQGAIGDFPIGAFGAAAARTEDRDRAGPDDLLGANGEGRLEDVERAFAIDFQGAQRVLLAAGAERGREVDDAFGFGVLRNAQDVRQIRDVARDELDLGHPFGADDLRQELAVQGEVEDGDVVPLAHEIADHVGADETRAAGDEIVHVDAASKHRSLPRIARSSACMTQASSDGTCRKRQGAHTNTALKLMEMRSSAAMLTGTS